MGGANTYSYVDGNPVMHVDRLGLTREDITRLTQLAQDTQPDLNVPARVHTMTMVGGGLGFTMPWFDWVFVNDKFLAELTDADRAQLLQTIIHESIHRTRDWRDSVKRPVNHPDIYKDAEKRRKAIDATVCY